MKITKSQLRKLIREQAGYVAKSPRDSSPVTYGAESELYSLAAGSYDTHSQDHKIIEAFGGKDEYIQRVANVAEHQGYAGGYGGVRRGVHEWVVLNMVRERV